MACVVQKFGGTSVATLERIQHAAKIVAETYKRKSTAVVVSAMAGITSKFVMYARELNSSEGDPEYDAVVSSGEIVAAGLFAISLKNLGIKARSYTGWQVPIYTNNTYGSAIIQEVDVCNLEKDLQAGIIPVICGFQGISSENRVTTLSRGGSDLTAVAIAAALKADVCEIYSDVNGLYTVDPNVYPKGIRLDQIHYNAIKEMAAQGAKVLQEQAIDYAIEKKVKILLASSFVDVGGTIVDNQCKEKKYCGIAIIRDMLQFRIHHNMNSSEYITNILQKYRIRCEILKESADKLSILVDKRKTQLMLAILNAEKQISSVKQEMIRKHFSCVSIAGKGITAEDCLRITALLKNSKIEIFYCSMRDYSISLVVSADCLMKAIEVLHKGCGFEK